MTQLLTLMLGFYITCVLLGCWAPAPTCGGLDLQAGALPGPRVPPDLLDVVVGSPLPRLIARWSTLAWTQHHGVVVPTGYSFNLDGTAIYLTMASLFIADALGSPLAVGEQIGLLVFMIVASKGAAGVTGAGLATLAGGLQSHRPDLLDGVGLIVGIDRFMSEARAVTNFSGNAVATVLVGSWTKTIDRDKVNAVLRGDDPFDELTMVDDDHTPRAVEPGQQRIPAPA